MCRWISRQKEQKAQKLFLGSNHLVSLASFRGFLIRVGKAKRGH